MQFMKQRSSISTHTKQKIDEIFEQKNKKLIIKSDCYGGDHHDDDNTIHLLCNEIKRFFFNITVAQSW